MPAAISSRRFQPRPVATGHAGEKVSHSRQPTSQGDSWVLLKHRTVPEKRMLGMDRPAPFPR